MALVALQVPTRIGQTSLVLFRSGKGHYQFGTVFAFALFMNPISNNAYFLLCCSIATLRMRIPRYLRRTGVVLLLFSPIVGANSTPSDYTTIDKIRETARQFVVAKLTGESENKLAQDIHISVNQLDPRLRLATCATPLESYLAPGSRLMGHTTVGVRCASPQAWSLYVPIHIEQYLPVLTLVRPISRGQTLDAEDLLVKKRSSTSIPAKYLKSGESILGLIAARDIMPGAVLTQSMFKAKTLVRRGDRVVLSMKSGVVAVRTSGVALSDGAVGDRVKVRNLSSERVIDGTVAAANLVLIGSADLR
ncbi:MAG: flagellar basal body P-ring formation chaperone FlgA [Pseudomonadota bacterium]